MADKYGITKNCVTEATVKSATFDEKTSKWEVKYIRDGEIKTMTSNVYVGAVGQVSFSSFGSLWSCHDLCTLHHSTALPGAFFLQLSNPKIPTIKGQDIFKGQVCSVIHWHRCSSKESGAVVMSVQHWLICRLAILHGTSQTSTLLARMSW